MQKEKRVITGWQLFCLILNAMVGVGIFALAGQAGAVAGRGALLSIPLTGLLVLLQLIFIYLLAKRFPRQELNEYITHIIGQLPGKAYLLGYTFVALGLAVITCRSYWLLVSAWILNTTPQAVFLVPLVFVCWNVAQRGVVTTARTVELLNYGALALILILMIPVLKIDWDFIRPLTGNGVNRILRGVVPCLQSFLGVDILLIVFPFVRSKRTLPIAVSAVAFTTVFYTLTALFTFGSLSVELATLSRWSLQHYLNRFAFALFERADIVFLVIWTFQIINVIAIHMYAAIHCLGGVLGPQKQSQTSLLVFMVMAVAVLMPTTEAAQLKIIAIYSPISLFYLGVFPLLFWLIALLRGKKGESVDEQKDAA